MTYIEADPPLARPPWLTLAPCLLAPPGRMGDYYGIDGDEVPVQSQDYIPPADEFAVGACVGQPPLTCP